MMVKRYKMDCGIQEEGTAGRCHVFFVVARSKRIAHEQLRNLHRSVIKQNTMISLLVNTALADTQTTVTVT